MYNAIVLFAIAVSTLAPGRRFAFRLPPRVRDALEHPASLPLALVCVLAAQHAYLALIVDASYNQTPDLAVLRQMPIRIINDVGGSNHIDSTYGERFAGLAVIESLGLGAAYHALARPRLWQLALIGIAAVAAYAEALGARAGTSADMYAYVGFTLLGSHAYAPPHVAFPGPYSVINTWWGTPMVPATYGPFWLALAAAVAGAAPTLIAKIIALRLLGAGALLAIVALLASLGFPARILALIALNPALVMEFVANVHNDLLAVALLLGARLAARRGTILPTMALAALAVLVKLPFLLFAALAFVPIASRRTRIAAYAATAVVALGVSWLWGGPAYLAALLHLANALTGGHALAMLANPAMLVKAAALVGIALAFFADTWIEGLAWTLPAVSVAFFPWYLSWSLPYAVTSEDMLRNVAIALPLVTLVAGTGLGNGRVIVVLEIATYCWLTVAFAHLIIARRRT